MKDDQFVKLFQYLEEFRAEVNQRHDAQDEKINKIYNILDAHLKKKKKF